MSSLLHYLGLPGLLQCCHILHACTDDVLGHVAPQQATGKGDVDGRLLHMMVGTSGCALNPSKRKAW